MNTIAGAGKALQVQVYVGGQHSLLVGEGGEEEVEGALFFDYETPYVDRMDDIIYTVHTVTTKWKRATIHMHEYT